MKKTFVIALLIGAAFGAKAQYRFVTRNMTVGKGHPEFPFYWAPYVWWNDSTVTMLRDYSQKDTVGNLQIQINFLLQDDLETHRRLDSLILAIRPKRIELSPQR